MPHQHFKSKGLHVLNYVQRHEDVWGSEDITPYILDLIDTSGQVHSPFILLPGKVAL